MNRTIRMSWTAGLLALAATAVLPPAYAGQNAAAIEMHRERQAAEAAARNAPPPPPAPQAQPQPRGSAPGAAAPRYRGPPPSAGEGRQIRPYRPGDDGSRAVDRSGRPVVIGPPRGSQARGDVRIVPPSRAYVTRPPRVIDRLPPAHRHYDWRGSRYYWGGGHWYRPYRDRYVIVRPPIGFYVSALPGAYSTIWVGGTRYYYADGTYFTYEPVRRSYVVTRSPYGDEAEYEDYDDEGGAGEGVDADLFIYPMRGQSEQQQQDDRYECHRWAADQVRYDPTDDAYDREKRSDYDRALTACLTGRGYSVK